MKPAAPRTRADGLVTVRPQESWSDPPEPRPVAIEAPRRRRVRREGGGSAKPGGTGAGGGPPASEIYRDSTAWHSLLRVRQRELRADSQHAGDEAQHDIATRRRERQRRSPILVDERYLCRERDDRRRYAAP